MIQTDIESLLAEAIQRLVHEFQPEQIFLFGSRAWGKPNEDSDLDLLVVVTSSDEKPTQRAVRAYHSLAGIPTSIDVLVKTRAEVERFRHVYASLEAEILERGKIIYDGRSKARPGTKLAEQSAA